VVARSSVAERVTVDITGVVQGVGFRPTLRVLAEEAGLSGWVQNRSGSVRLFLDGRRDNVERFLSVLPSRLPLRARLDRLTVIDRKLYRSEPEPWRFEIRSSEADEALRISIPADLGSCETCLAEVFEPTSRYYRYPFTTCTDCGPRYTVVTGMPYDRNQTTLADFPLCPACKQEYGDPRNRRFHAQSMACATCGPHLQVHDKFGAVLSGDPIRLARKALAHGQVIAVRRLPPNDGGVAAGQAMIAGG
jgi:hydrogenase maturation protein HypF